MGQKFLIDTNILIYVFSRDLPKDITKEMNKIFLESFIISVISKMEFLGWKEATSSDYEKAKEFLTNSLALPLDEQIVQKTIDLKRKKKIKLPDAIIAATCLIHNITLMTRNEKDFSGIDDLKMYNPFVKKSHINGK